MLWREEGGKANDSGIESTKPKTLMSSLIVQDEDDKIHKR